jgi:pilus assembly protein CpaB
MRRPTIFVLLAGVAALAAALVVYSALKKREAEVRQAMAQTVQIVVAAQDLPLGTKIEPSSVKLARWSRDSIPPGAFTNSQAVMNAYVKSSFVQNEPIVADRLFTGQKEAGVLPLLIPPGMRAMSVPVDEVSDIAGFVLPHSHVDILVSVSNAAPDGKTLSKIVLENVEVLAVAQEIEKVNDKPQVVKVVTLLVTPEEAERLALASGQGTLRLAMRNYDDKKVVYTRGADVRQLVDAYSGGPVMQQQEQHGVGRARAVVRVRPRPKPVTVEVLRNGTSAQSVSFVRDGAVGKNHEDQQEHKSAPPGTTSAVEGNTRTAEAAHPAALAASKVARADTPARKPTSAHRPEEGRPATGMTTTTLSDVALGPRSKTIDVR